MVFGGPISGNYHESRETLRPQARARLNLPVGSWLLKGERDLAELNLPITQSQIDFIGLFWDRSRGMILGSSREVSIAWL